MNRLVILLFSYKIAQLEQMEQNEQMRKDEYRKQRNELGL